jgi:hypothetical protein
MGGGEILRFHWAERAIAAVYRRTNVLRRLVYLVLIQYR